MKNFLKSVALFFSLIYLFLKAVFYPYFTDKDVARAAESPYTFDFLDVIAGGNVRKGERYVWLPEANPLPYWWDQQKKRIFNSKDKKGQSLVKVNLLLLVGIATLIMIYFAVVYMVDHRPANTITDSISASSSEIEDIYMETLEHAAQRHGAIVYEVAKNCNSHSGNAQAHLKWISPRGLRNAYPCFYNNMWWVVVEGDTIDGDDIVTVFPRKTAKTLQDVIDYLTTHGYTQ